MAKFCQECAAPAVRFDPVSLCAGCFESHHLFCERIAIKIESGIDLAVAMRQAEEELLTPEKRQDSLFEVEK